ncbi:hypothetical protein ACGF0J_04190 [Nonomuraea sp. NPDC047897]|uniref:hypothetical protein n=1 Tax=Nonomuraea sp. NPDC047897 TaxID=3364346 RepID=UPI003721EE85
MCTASFRMPMDDVGRLLDTLDDGYAEATGEQPAVPAHDPGTEVIPGTGQYQRPPQPVSQPVSQPVQQPMPQAQHSDERPTATLSPNDVLVARGTPAPDKPAPQDKLVASYSETTPPRGTPAPQQPPPYPERDPFTGPQYTDPGAGQSYGGSSYRDPGRADPFTGPQYVDEATPTGPQYSLDPDPFSGPHQVAASGERGYQLRPAPLSTDPLGFPSQAADPLGTPRREPRGEPRQERYATSDSGYQQSAGTAGLGTPMHGIPGAGRRRDAAPPPPSHDRYPSQDTYAGQDPYAGQDTYAGQETYSSLDTPYPDAYRSADGYSGQDTYPGQDAYPPPRQSPANPVDPLLALSEPGPPHPQHPQQDATPLSRPYVAGDSMFSTGERLHPEERYDDRRYDERPYGEAQYDRRYDERGYDDRGERRDW